MVKSLDLFFFESYNKCFICESFSFGLNLFQSCPYVCSASCFKVSIDHLLILITLSLEKEIIVLEKVWKKSWILDPKIRTNPECSSNDPVFLREWTVFYLKLTLPWHEQSSLEIKRFFHFCCLQLTWCLICLVFTFLWKNSSGVCGSENLSKESQLCRLSMQIYLVLFICYYYIY